MTSPCLHRARAWLPNCAHHAWTVCDPSRRADEGIATRGQTKCPRVGVPEVAFHGTLGSPPAAVVDEAVGPMGAAAEAAAPPASTPPQASSQRCTAMVVMAAEVVEASAWHPVACQTR